MDRSLIQENWEVLLRFLPEDWACKAVELGALARRRKIQSAETLLRVLLVHLADGKSLRTTATYAQEAGLCDVNDVALLHRLRASQQWLRWMTWELMQRVKGCSLPDHLTRKYRVRVVDASSVQEPGSTGTDWRIHYCLQIHTLCCDTFRITSPKVGESFQRFPVEKGDLLMGSRAYCQRKGMMHVLNHQGQVLVRFHSTNVPLFTRGGTPWPVLDHLRTLREGETGDWNVWFLDPATDALVKARLCALRKSEEAIQRAQKELRRTASRKNRKVRAEIFECAEYVIVLTTVNRHNFSGKDTLSLYQGRWQIDSVFKRLKSILGMGHVPKYNSESCIAWLYGKMLVALLMERIHQEAEFFSPWGYPV